jgi:hypothetical protein
LSLVVNGVLMPRGERGTSPNDLAAEGRSSRIMDRKSLSRGVA